MEINRLPFRPTIEGVDLLENVFVQTLRARNGYIDESFIAHRMNVAFKSCAKTQGPGNVNFTEFFAVAGRLGLVAPGTQGRVEALYNRYDIDGTGILRYEHFTGALMGLVPNGETTQPIRTALQSFRRAAGRENPYSLLLVSAALQSTAVSSSSSSSSYISSSSSTNNSSTLYATVASTYSPSALNPPSEFLSRANAQRLLILHVPDASRYDLQTILAEASRPHGGNNINPREFSLMLRGNLPRNRRTTLSHVWNNYLVPLKNAQGYVPLNHILPDTENSVQKYLPPQGFANEHDFIEFYRYVSAVFVSDAQFDDHIQLAFGVNDTAGSRAPAEGRGSSNPSNLLSSTSTTSFSFGNNKPSLSSGNTLAPISSAINNTNFDSTISRSTIRGRGVAASSSSTTTTTVNPSNNTSILPGSPLAVFKGIAEGRIPPEPGINDVGNMVGVCLYNTLGRGVPPIGKEVILGRPQRVPQYTTGAPFGIGAPQAVPVGTMLLRGVGVNVSKDNKSASTAAAEYLKYTQNKGNPQWRHNRPTSLFGKDAY